MASGSRSGRRAGDGEGRDPRERSLDEPNRQRRGVARERDGRGGGVRREVAAGRVCGLQRLQQRRRVLPRRGVQSGRALPRSSSSFSLSTVLPENARWRSVVTGPGSTCTDGGQLIGDRLVDRRRHGGAQVAEAGEVIADDLLEIGADQVHQHAVRPRLPQLIEQRSGGGVARHRQHGARTARDAIVERDARLGAGVRDGASRRHDARREVAAVEIETG